MLVLSRKWNQRIVINGNVVLTVVSIGDGKVRIGIDAPMDVGIQREEVWRRDHPGEPLPHQKRGKTSE